MSINPYSLESKSLTPTDFARLSLSSRLSLNSGEDSEEETPPTRKRSFSESQILEDREDISGQFSKSNYIKVQHLTVEVAGNFFGFSAFFLAFVSSSTALAAKIARIQYSDDMASQIIKKTFFECFIKPCLACHAQQIDQSKRLRILVQHFAPLLNYFYDHGPRSDRLTRKTLEEGKGPVRLPFPFQTPEDIPPGTSQQEIVRFFDFRDTSINLRATDGAYELPTCIEYFENYLRRMGHTIESIKNDLKVIFLQSLKEDEEIEIFLTDAFFEETADRQLGVANPPKHVMFLRDRNWKIDKDNYFVPSFELTARTVDKQVSYRLKSVTYLNNPQVMDYSTLMIQPSGEGFKWSREYKTPSWEGDVQSSLQALADLIEKKELRGEHFSALRIDAGLVENTDCCIYELV